MDGYVRDEALSLSGLFSFEFSVAHGPVTIVHYIWKFRCFPRPLLTVFLASRTAWILRTATSERGPERARCALSHVPDCALHRHQLGCLEGVLAPLHYSLRAKLDFVGYGVVYSIVLKSKWL